MDISEVTQAKVVLGARLLNPIDGFETLLSSLSGTDQPQARAELFQGLVSIGGGGQGQRNALLLLQEFGDSVPVYFSDYAVAAAMLVWLVVPIVVGYVVFQRADL